MSDFGDQIDSVAKNGNLEASERPRNPHEEECSTLELETQGVKSQTEVCLQKQSLGESAYFANGVVKAQKAVADLLTQASKLGMELSEIRAGALGNGRDNEREKPIRFKDAVGRKFSFPFQLCRTWDVCYARDSIHF